MVQFTDLATVSGTKETAEGFLIADAFAVRTGIQVYAGYEVGMPDVPMVNVYRSEQEVFHKDTLTSFAHIPVTNDHPTEYVTVENWKQYAVGETSNDVLRDGHKMRIPLIVKDKAAIADIKGGKRELSAGYSCELEFIDGYAPDGTPYQAIQKHIRANHLAIVKHGRAGPDFKIGDQANRWGASPITDYNHEENINMKKIILDGISIETTEQGAEAINKLQNQIKDQLVKLESVANDSKAVAAVKDEEIGKLKAGLADATKKVEALDIDALVASRLALVTDAQKIVKDLKINGLSDADIRRQAVSAKYGEAIVKDASDAEIAGMFKAATADAANQNNDPVANALQNKATADANINDNGQSAYNDRISNAHRATLKQA